MPTHSPTPSEPSRPAAPEPIAAPELAAWPLPKSLWHDAAARLVSTDPRETEQAAAQLVAQSEAHGIDFGLAVATIRDGSIRQVCLPVLGGGRTAMLFVSRPGQGGSLGTPEAQQAERIAAVRGALDRLRGLPAAGLAQGLSLPSERFAIEAYEAVGMARIAELRYMNRPLAHRRGSVPKAGSVLEPPKGGAWPGGAEIRAYSTSRPDLAADTELATAIEASYEQTLDCPGLRPMRNMADVVASHRETGDWTPGLWWVVRMQGEPAGCLLFNPCPAEDSVELTYMGLAPSARGLGLAPMLLDRGIEHAERLGLGSLRCAVDVANTPAMKLYERAGFAPMASRIAHACSVEA